MSQYNWNVLVELFASMLSIGEEMHKILFDEKFDTKDLKKIDDIVDKRATLMKQIANELKTADLNDAPENIKKYVFETESKIREYEAEHLEFLKAGAKESANKMRGLYKQKSLLIYEKR